MAMPPSGYQGPKGKPANALPDFITGRQRHSVVAVGSSEYKDGKYTKHYRCLFIPNRAIKSNPCGQPRVYAPTSSFNSVRHSLFFSSAINASNRGAAPVPAILLKAATARSVLL